MIDLSSNSVLEAIDFSEVGITDGLVAWYPLNGNTRDYTENRNDATNYGATITNGLNQLAYSFDGSGQHIMIADNLTLKMPSMFSVSFFFKTNKPRSYMVSKGDGAYGTKEWNIGFNTEGKIALRVVSSDNNKSKHLKTIELYTDNEWHNACFSWATGNLLLFIDGGMPSLEILQDDAFNDIYNSSSSVCIGTELWGGPVGSYKFDGKIQDVRIYNRALSEKEIKLMYELTKNKNTHFTKNNEVFIPGEFNEVN